MNKIKLQTKDYFIAFSGKNTKKLNDMYADSISLIDWIDSAQGKENVLEMNQNLFNSFNDIKINIKNMYCVKNVASCEIEILLDNRNKRTILKVVDIIEYDESAKIVAIRAYLGGEKEETKIKDGNMGPYDYDG
ncbi:MAG: nuclear transport factor 2 family protein [Acholeplasmataceae bacterium]